MEGGFAVLVSLFCKDPSGAGSIPCHFAFCSKFRKQKKMKRGRPIAETGCAPVCRNRRNGRNGRRLGFARLVPLFSPAPLKIDGLTGNFWAGLLVPVCKNLKRRQFWLFFHSNRMSGLALKNTPSVP